MAPALANDTPPRSAVSWKRPVTTTSPLTVPAAATPMSSDMPPRRALHRGTPVGTAPSPVIMPPSGVGIIMPPSGVRLCMLPEIDDVAVGERGVARVVGVDEDDAAAAVHAAVAIVEAVHRRVVLVVAADRHHQEAAVGEVVLRDRVGEEARLARGRREAAMRGG